MTKTDFTIMIQSADDKVSGEVVKKIQAKFTDLNVVSKQWETSNAEKTIKTSIASGQPIDLAMYWPNQMDTFVNADMALDLTPYLEENGGAWKKSFTDDALKIGEYNGKVYAVPYASVYPLIEVNKDILDKAGVTIPDGSWTWDEFIKTCATIKEKTGIYPVGINKDWASWTVRNGLLSSWTDKTKMEEFIAGKIPFTDPAVVKVFDSAKELYTNYAYPGEGAISATLDQVNIAFKQGKIAMKFDVNFLASQSIKDSGLKNIQIVSWPKMGSLDYVLGGSNGYMIPANTQHPKEAIEVMKYITSPEIMQLYVDNGTAVTVKDVKSSDPNFALYSKDCLKIYPKEVMQLSPQINDYIDKKTPSNYIFNGKTALDEIEKLRQEALNAK
jgi:ABC-type glycerol-3-phosphate transport system substrate-binding protein